MQIKQGETQTLCHNSSRRQQQQPDVSQGAKTRLLSGSKPAPAPKFHTKGKSSVSELPSFGKETQEPFPFITISGPSLGLHPRPRPRTWRSSCHAGGEHSHSNTSLLQLGLFLGCSHVRGLGRASCVPGRSAPRSRLLSGSRVEQKGCRDQARSGAGSTTSGWECRELWGLA